MSFFGKLGDLGSHRRCVFVGSPFNIPIRDRIDPNKVRCYGPGLEPNGARAGVPATFTVDASQAGEAPIAVRWTSGVLLRQG